MKFPITRQEGFKDCGAACLSMIIKYYKGYASMEYLREITHTTKSGTNAYHLIGGASDIGFDAKGFKVDMENIDSLVFPCIAHVTLDKKYNHFVVIYGVSKNYIKIADPANGLKNLKREDFKKIFNNVIIILHPLKNMPIQNKTQSFLEFSFSIVKKYKKLFTCIILFSLFITTLSIVTSFYFKNIYEATLSSKTSIILIFILFFIVYLYKVFTEYFRNKLVIDLNQKINLNLTQSVFQDVLSLPYNYFKSRTTGEVISRINDLNSIKDFIGQFFVTIFVDIVLTLLVSLTLYFVCKPLFLFSILIIVIYVLASLIFLKLYEKNIEKIQRQRADINSFMTESISAFETIKGLNLKEKITKKFNRKYVLHIKQLFKFNTIYNLEYFFKEFISQLGVAIMILIGCILLYENKITVGELLAFNALFSYLLEPIKNIINTSSSYKEAKSAIKRVQELHMDIKDEGVNVAKIKSIEFKSTNYSYDNDLSLLKDINLRIDEREKIVIMGESGSGKSTMLKLIKKYYQAKDNSIYINDINLNSVTKSSIDSKIVYISQNEMLFTDTLINNIKLERNIKDNNLIEICKLCLVDSIYKNNNLGINMLIEENGFNLSGGERQRIILARSLVNYFDVLIIDEGLNQTDISTERKILKNLINKYKDKIIIYVTHRKNNIDLFDRFINIEKGEIKIDETRNRFI